MDDGVVIDGPGMNRWALGGLVVAGLVAASGFFLMSVLQGQGVPFGTAFLGIAGVEAGAGIASVYFVMHLHPDDGDVERY